ncbi:MAG: hypothetical protein WD604_04585 [Balneolaceae bacterium]
MHKFIPEFTSQVLLVGFLFLILNGCDVTGDSDPEESIEPGFSYEIVDDDGETLNKVTHEKVDDIDVETSLGLFGNNFIPAEMLDRISQHLGVDPETLKQDEIILHAEKGIEQEVHFASLRFSFPPSLPLQAGTFQIYSLTKEQWLNTLRLIWEIRQSRGSENPLPENNLHSKGGIGTANEMINMNYYEFGFGLQDTMFMFISTGGSLELDEVNEEFVMGNFSVELMGVPMDILEAEEFPEAPDVHTVRIIGDFVAEPGDFDDLKRIRFNLLEDAGIPFIPLF